MIHGILGTSYCGSTILAFLLGGHSKIFSVSETTSFKRRGKDIKCTMCSMKEIDCSFWTKDLLMSCLDNMDKRYTIIEQAAKEKSGKDITLFSDKVSGIYKTMLEHNNIEKFIIIFKRPEAFYYSYTKHRRMREKYDTIQSVCDIYYKHYNNDKNFLEQYNKPHMYLFYEDLCNKTEFVIKRICNFLDIEFEEQMLKYWEADLHTLEGNAGPYMSMLSGEDLKRVYTTKNLTSTGKSHKEWYAANKKKLTVDNRWQSELYPKEIEEVQAHKISQEMWLELLQKKI